MNIASRIRRFFDPSGKYADKALSLSIGWAKSAREGYRNQYKFLRDVDEDVWEFCVVAICLFVVLSEIRGLYRGDQRKQSRLRTGMMNRIKDTYTEGTINAPRTIPGGSRRSPMPRQSSISTRQWDIGPCRPCLTESWTMPKSLGRRATSARFSTRSLACSGLARLWIRATRRDSRSSAAGAKVISLSSRRA